MSILKLKSVSKNYIWGGERLRKEFGIESRCFPLAEAWMLSCHPDGPSTIENGPFAGKTLSAYMQRQGREILGNNGVIFQNFPILIKLIDARDNLSIQVHPSNLYSMEHENQYGKTEMWYVLDAEPDAVIYYGFRKEIGKDEFERRIRDNSLLDVLNAVPARKGDVFFIAPGTLHGIGKGTLIAEIQQNSNVTYRVFDFDRQENHGKPRQLHVEKAMEVTQRVPPRTDWNFGNHLARCEYFTVDRYVGGFNQNCDDDSFTSILVIDGEGEIVNGEEKLQAKKGDSFFLPARSGIFQMTGNCTVLHTRIGTI